MQSLCYSLFSLLFSATLIGAALPAAAQFNPQETLPGWSTWMATDGQTDGGYETGFSNGDALQQSAWGLYCTDQATEAKVEPTYWYRVSDLVDLIGTGYAEEGCLINGDLYTSGPLVAVKTGLNYRACLRVQADVGHGLVLRREPRMTSDRLGVIPNSATLYVDSLPYALQPDDTGRQWLRIDRPQPGWVSVTAQLGKHVNLRLCPQ